LNGWDFLAALVWPILLFAIYLDQRHHLPRLAEWLKDRPFKFGAAGMTAEVQARQRSDDKNPVASEKAGDSPSRAQATVRPRSPAAAAATIAENALHETQDLTQQERAIALAAAYANARVLGAFEFVFNRIYGTQLEALKLLRDAPEVSILEANEFYQRVVTAYPDFYRGYPFSRWAGWMEGQSLIEQRPNGFAITQFGREFLAYLAEVGLDVRRPY